MAPVEIKLKSNQSLNRYKNRWLALSDRREIVASAISAELALKLALKRGVKDPILTHVPKELGSYIL